MNIERLLQRDYWYAIAESIWTWVDREVFIGHTLVNLVAVVASILLAGFIARALKPKLSVIIEKRISEHTVLSRFLAALEKILNPAVATILLCVHRYQRQYRIFNAQRRLDHPSSDQLVFFYYYYQTQNWYRGIV